MDTTPTHIHTQSDLHATWSRLLSRAEPSRPMLWMMLIEADDTPIRHLTELDELDAVPPPELVDGMAVLLSELVADLPGARVAFLLGRPGRGPVTADDRSWATALAAAARRAGMACDVVHLLAGGRILPLPEDELGAPLSA